MIGKSTSDHHVENRRFNLCIGWLRNYQHIFPHRVPLCDLLQGVAGAFQGMDGGDFDPDRTSFDKLCDSQTSFHFFGGLFLGMLERVTPLGGARSDMRR
jgi:hypothetical protein